MSEEIGSITSKDRAEYIRMTDADRPTDQDRPVARLPRTDEGWDALREDVKNMGTTDQDRLLDDDSPHYDGCYQCGGAGYLVTCPDDICRGADKCMHGDGEENCPTCNKDGMNEWIY